MNPLPPFTEWGVVSKEDHGCLANDQQYESKEARDGRKVVGYAGKVRSRLFPGKLPIGWNTKTDVTFGSMNLYHLA